MTQISGKGVITTLAENSYRILSKAQNAVTNLWGNCRHTSQYSLIINTVLYILDVPGMSLSDTDGGILPWLTF